ncbi:MAG: hypothetical protein NZ843_00670 [Fimbriimonadales bacterium]|nr:hypothetical protein [Fimbriimonadales bacterium]
MRRYDGVRALGGDGATPSHQRCASASSPTGYVLGQDFPSHAHRGTGWKPVQA